MQNNMVYEEAVRRAYSFLEKEFSYKDVTLRHYRNRWLPIKEYMEIQGLEAINPSVCKDFLFGFYGGRAHNELTEDEKLIEKSVLVLTEFLETGSVKRKSKIRYLDGPIGKAISDYLNEKQSRRLKAVTVEKITSHLSSFNFWLTANNINSISAIKQAHIIAYIQSLESHKKALVHDTLMDLRAFFTFLYKRNLIDIDIARFIPKDNYQKQAKIPSYYTEEEIGRLLQAVDRGNSVGKRDYAILVLSAYLGLRASDIARLQFRNLHWEQGVIVFRQYKTGKDVTLPLLPIVGNALIDYIQYGRPGSGEQYVFLYIISPFLPIQAQAIAGMINRRFINAGFRSKSRRHGGHALRHSLVKELLNNKQSLPVISEVLGHRSTTSTRHYIRIDTDSLVRCALDVPAVDPLFYAQEGGLLFL